MWFRYDGHSQSPQPTNHPPRTAYPTNRKIPTNHWVGWIPIFACIYVCLCVSHVTMGTLYTLETSTSGYIVSTSTKKKVFFLKKSVFRFFFDFFFTFQDRMSMLSWCIVDTHTSWATEHFFVLILDCKPISS